MTDDDRCWNPECDHPYSWHRNRVFQCRACDCPMTWGPKCAFAPDPKDPSKVRRTRRATEELT